MPQKKKKTTKSIETQGTEVRQVQCLEDQQ